MAETICLGLATSIVTRLALHLAQHCCDQLITFNDMSLALLVTRFALPQAILRLHQALIHRASLIVHLKRANECLALL